MGTWLDTNVTKWVCRLPKLVAIKQRYIASHAENVVCARGKDGDSFFRGTIGEVSYKFIYVL
jgi:hypothetical protein